ncbi:MAG TPA: hypothetical protein VG758_27400 [Hyphomicrobiaceae bacterium]|nr:hypothetical protein [Hyphomicrobiaceae bacterium]
MAPAALTCSRSLNDLSAISEGRAEIELTPQEKECLLIIVTVGIAMRARQLIGRAGFPADDLPVILEGFEDAWAEIGPGAGSDAIVIEVARLHLAAIVVDIAKTGPIHRGRINAAAVDAFRSRRWVARR